MALSAGSSSSTRRRCAHAQKAFAGALAAASALTLATSTSAEPNPPCQAWDVEYGVNANLRITDTTLGAGDGTYAIGPGRLVVRFDGLPEAAGSSAHVVHYELRDHFVVKASYLLVSATITTETVTRTTNDAEGKSSSADGVREGRLLRWTTDWRGMHSDGTLSCEGNLCGKFGAPPPGLSPLHVPPHAAHFKSFEYANDGQTFRMDWSVESHQDSPSETSLIALAGRETKRTCVRTGNAP